MRATTCLKVGLRYGALLGVAVNVNVQVLTWLGLGLTSWVFGIGMLLLVVALTLALRAAAAGSGFADDLLIGAVVVIVAGIMQQTYLLLYLLYIDPEWVDQVIEIRRQAMAAAGAPEAEIANRLERARAGFAPALMLTRGVLVPGLWNMLVVALVSAATRRWRRRPTPVPAPDPPR